MFDKEFLFKTIKRIYDVDSPSGYTLEMMDLLETITNEIGYPLRRTNKGNGFVLIAGEKTNYTIGLSAHVDTLGLMVRSIASDGTLAVTNIGGPIIPTLDGEYCKIYTRENKVYTGTILSKSPAVHVYKDAASRTRNIEEIFVRIDEVVKTKEDVEALGIDNGDFVCYDSKTMITDKEFIKSRFIDDKISVAILLTYLKYLKDHQLNPQVNIVCLFSTYEEVGHGMAYLPVKLDELISVDMGCIGLDLKCDEYMVSICAKDSSGPYDYQITSRFVELAKKHQLNYAVDIYPYYGSDTSAALSAGNDIKGGLIGPGVHASHGMERTHMLALMETLKLICYYTVNEKQG